MNVFRAGKCRQRVKALAQVGHSLLALPDMTLKDGAARLLSLPVQQANGACYFLFGAQQRAPERVQSGGVMLDGHGAILLRAFSLDLLGFGVSTFTPGAAGVMSITTRL